MNPSDVITITTDFGHKGPFAAVMKGVILGRFPAARVVDQAHDIPAHWPPEAGFWVSRAYSYFPRGTVHVAIVDPLDSLSQRGTFIDSVQRHQLAGTFPTLKVQNSSPIARQAISWYSKTLPPVTKMPPS